MTLATEVKMLHELVADLDQSVEELSLDELDPKDTELISLSMIGSARKVLADVERRLGDKLGVAMGTRYLDVEGAGRYERSPRRDGSTKCIDEEGLWRLTLDTRIVDPDTGEVLPQYEVIRRVYGAESRDTGKVRLTGASPTKVEALGINPDDFFEKADRVGWTVKLK